jgi:hypothetical protein
LKEAMQYSPQWDRDREAEPSGEHADNAGEEAENNSHDLTLQWGLNAVYVSTPSAVFQALRGVQGADTHARAALLTADQF